MQSLYISSVYKGNILGRFIFGLQMNHIKYQSLIYSESSTNLIIIKVLHHPLNSKTFNNEVCKIENFKSQFLINSLIY